MKFLQNNKYNILLSMVLADIFIAFSQLKMLRRSHKTDCNNIILPILLINLSKEECNVTKGIHFQIWFNTVRRTSDLRKVFLEHLEVQILPFGTNHGGVSGWPSTSHNSTNAQIRTLDQPLPSPQVTQFLEGPIPHPHPPLNKGREFQLCLKIKNI